MKGREVVMRAGSGVKGLVVVAGFMSFTGCAGGVTGRDSLGGSEAFGEGSLLDGPRILAKDIGLLALSDFCRVSVKSSVSRRWDDKPLSIGGESLMSMFQ